MQLHVYNYMLHLTTHAVTASSPTDLMLVQEGPTSIRVSWTPPTPLRDTTGYRIVYVSETTVTVDVSGGSTDNFLLTGLLSGDTYTIVIYGTSENDPSVDSLIATVTLGKKQSPHSFNQTLPQSLLQWSQVLTE